MKTAKRIFLVFLFAVIFISCGVESPESVVKKFNEAVAGMDFRTAKELAAKEFAPTFDVLIQMVEDELLDAPKDDNSNIIVIKSSEVNSDENAAVVVVEIVDHAGIVIEESRIPLIKEDGEWKIVIE